MLYTAAREIFLAKDAHSQVAALDSLSGNRNIKPKGFLF